MGSAFFDLEDRPQNTGQALRAFPYHNLHLGTSLSPALGRGCGRTPELPCITIYKTGEKCYPRGGSFRESTR